jgi:hypothetical protein
MNRTFAWVGWLGLWTVAVGTAQPPDPQPEKLLPPEQILEVLTSSKSSNEAKKLALASVAPDGGMNEPIYRQIGRRLLEMLNVPKETPLTPDIIAALARLGRWEFDLVKDGLTWQSWQVRRDTALALGLMDEFGLEAIPNLAALANDPDWPVRQAVANALGRLLKADAERQSSYANHRKALIGLAKDRVWNVRMTALNSLGEIDSEALGVTVIKQIESATQDKEWPVRKAAVVALGKLKSKRSLPVLLDLAKPPGDPHPEVRDAAKEAVRLIDSDEAIRQGLIVAPKKE